MQSKIQTVEAARAIAKFDDARRATVTEAIASVHEVEAYMYERARLLGERQGEAIALEQIESGAAERVFRDICEQAREFVAAGCYYGPAIEAQFNNHKRSPTDGDTLSILNRADRDAIVHALAVVGIVGSEYLARTAMREAADVIESAVNAAVAPLVEDAASEWKTMQTRREDALDSAEASDARIARAVGALEEAGTTREIRAALDAFEEARARIVA